MNGRPTPSPIPVLGAPTAVQRRFPRQERPGGAARPVAVLVVAAAVLLGACSSASTAARRDPDLRSTGAETAVAVTVPTGPETLPTWQRDAASGKATLVVPADLLFAKDSSALSSAAATVLDLVVAEYAPGASVLVEGFADGDGEASYNQALSERRASATADWLAAHGVPRHAVTAVGWGETRPVAAETDEAGKAKNRRVAVTVTPPPPPPTVVARPAGASSTTATTRPRRTPGRLRTGARRSDDPPTPTRRSHS